jgi:hypothetical protein
MSLRFPQVDSLIGQFEGFGTAAAPSITAANNPGAIMYSPFAVSQGATGQSANGTAVFPDLATGLSALDTLVGRKIDAGIDTPSALAESWAPASAPGNSPTSTAAYAAYIAHGLGIGANDQIPSNAPGTGQDGSWIPPLPQLPSLSGGGLCEWIPGCTSAVDAAKAAGSAYDTAAGAVSWWRNLSFAQIAIGLIGFILLIAGLFSLRPVQQATTTVIRTARRGAEIFT